MREFKYVSRKEAALHKEKIISLIKAVQKEAKPYFTFRFDFMKLQAYLVYSFLHPFSE